MRREIEPSEEKSPSLLFGDVALWKETRVVLVESPQQDWVNAAQITDEVEGIELLAASGTLPVAKLTPLNESRWSPEKIAEAMTRGFFGYDSGVRHDEIYHQLLSGFQAEASK